MKLLAGNKFISRKSRIIGDTVKVDKPIKVESDLEAPLINVPSPYLPNTLTESKLSTLYLTGDFKLHSTEEQIMLIFKSKEKEISFEADRETNRVVVRLHSINKSGFSKILKLSFKELEQLFNSVKK